MATLYRTSKTFAVTKLTLGSFNLAFATVSLGLTVSAIMARYFSNDANVVPLVYLSLVSLAPSSPNAIYPYAFSLSRRRNLEGRLTL